VGVSDSELVNQFTESFKAVFSTLHKPFADVRPALDILDEKRLAVVTNGTSDLQRTKLKVSGLDPRFDAIVISAELGFGKPDPRIFEMTLKQIGVEPQECLMVGDSLFPRRGGSIHRWDRGTLA
jgi:HAD superfamily hydrolase (TIGR01549 family)